MESSSNTISLAFGVISLVAVFAFLLFVLIIFGIVFVVTHSFIVDFLHNFQVRILDLVEIGVECKTFYSFGGFVLPLVGIA